MINLRKSYEVTGYIIWQDYGTSYQIFCKGCYNDLACNNGEVRSIFLGSEWDHKPICDKCGEEIEVSVIKYET